MQESIMRHSNHFCFFIKNNPRRVKSDKKSLEYFEAAHGSYLLGNYLSFVFIYSLSRCFQQDWLDFSAEPERYLEKISEFILLDLCVMDPKRLDEVLNKNSSKKVYDEYDVIFGVRRFV